MTKTKGQSQRSVRSKLPAWTCFFVAVYTIVLGIDHCQRFFVAPPSNVREVEASLSRRNIAAALAAQALLPPIEAAQASGASFDRARMIRNVRKNCLPKILQGYSLLQASGSVDGLDDKARTKFTKCLTSYASACRISEVPDKTSRKLTKDAAAIQESLEAGDFSAVMKGLETYRTDIPADDEAATFQWSDAA
eukprot:TRINITY_DN64537_c0_g1_i1.p1 TRINITY_DN64537_c0_g1~~TRINITY_DN64537_c0_g1_i1.p1  ORF type:complete len:193 (-),score=33.20 TRINITY_DN64537_c0_g1_i1:64-642(-)